MNNSISSLLNANCCIVEVSQPGFEHILLQKTCLWFIMVHAYILVFVWCLCWFFSAYHRLFDLVVDGHNASTGGTAEEREEGP